jgi:flagellar biosynthesis protein FlhA
MNESVQQTAGGAVMALDPLTQQNVIKELREQSENAMAQGLQAVLLCSATIRLPLRRLVERYMPALNVLSYNEVSSRAEVEFVGQVKNAA